MSRKLGRRGKLGAREYEKDIPHGWYASREDSLSEGGV